uniref:Small ribosomal subunit protein uS11c n=1 Tax=Hypolytrum nemorum TaxID=76453 RepID=A0A288NBL3_9POAL|nr:ribosomal protein S11 [Hypolytrum nemorum]ANP26045.1 ribosomal protein S11 [Hypolytrum nemorum]QIB72654.1 ribosomal protein S11 [Cyperus glomeratus]QIB72746.1 ribosomal protein S11 [Cyperus difformis]
MKKAKPRITAPRKPRITAPRKPRITAPRMNRRLFYLRFRSRKTVRKIEKGIIHIQTSFHNTIITVTDLGGQVVSWDSAGTSRFKGPKRKTPYAAQIATKNAIHMLVKQGMKRAGVMIKGAGPGRAAALRTIIHSGVKLNFIRDVTPIPHNGCRPPKRRRV